MLQSAYRPSDPALTLPRVVPPRHHLSTPRFLFALFDNPLRILPEDIYEKPYVEQRLLGKQVIMVAEPALVEDVMKQTFGVFPKGDLEARVFEPMMGKGLLSADGDDWRAKRRISSPAFRHCEVTRYVPTLVRPFEDLASGWQTDPGIKRVHEAMTQATFRAVIDTIFSGSNSIDSAFISRAVTEVLSLIGWPIAYNTLQLPFATPHPGRSRMLREMHSMREPVRSFIRSRADDPHPPQDLGQTLIEATDLDGQRTLGEEDVIDMLLTLLLAGHETSANGLAWAVLMLAYHPALQTELRNEVADVVGDAPIAPGHVERLTATERFVKESMRLYPPAVMLRRTAREPVRLGGLIAEPGCEIIIPIYAIHRHRALWNEPHRFDPDRFLPENEAKRHRLAYLPFGAGPRICIGSGFAMTEMVAAIAALVRRLVFTPVSGFEPEPIARVTLRSRNGIMVEASPISSGGEGLSRSTVQDFSPPPVRRPTGAPSAPR